MPIWSFYSKTYIVILTCPSDMFPPVLPTFACFSDEVKIEGERGVVPRLPVSRCQTYVTGSRVFPLVEWEKCLMCVSGRLKCGLIRWTGKYDNISFRIKTSFL